MVLRTASTAAVNPRHHTTAPNSAPTPAVIAIASAPQKVTRHAPTRAPAPPTRAATAPSKARKTSDVPDTQPNQPVRGRQRRHGQRQHRADREAGGRRQRGLNRPRAEGLGDAELVARMGAERVVLHQLLGHLLRQARARARARHRWPSAHAVPRRDPAASSARSRDRSAVLGVGLRMDRDVLAGGHRHGAGHQPRDAGQQHVCRGSRRRPRRRPPDWRWRRCRRWRRARRRAASRCGRCGDVQVAQCHSREPLR